MRYLVIVLSAFFAVFLSACSNDAPADDMKLWYDEPAVKWVEALPVGNGRLGAMVFGGPQCERLQLNEETVWSGQPNSNTKTDVEAGALDRIRQLIFEGEYKAAEDMVNDKLFSWTNHGMAYQSVGDLYLEFPGHEEFAE